MLFLFSIAEYQQHKYALYIKDHIIIPSWFDFIMDPKILVCHIMVISELNASEALWVAQQLPSISNTSHTKSQNLKGFSCRLAVTFAHSIEAMC